MRPRPKAAIAWFVQTRWCEKRPLPTADTIAPTRYDLVDGLRGLAMVWMTGFHFCFDLSHFGYWPQDFRADPFWTVQRTLIVSLFLLCAGLGQSVAWHKGLGWPRFWRRWGQIMVCALLVTLGSYFMFPRSFIYFGVLHGMALMLLVARLTGDWGRWLWLAGLLALASPWLAAWLLEGPLAALAAVFNGRALNWLGWVTQKPFTEDYVPLFPWLGVMWWGMACGQWLLARHSHWFARNVPRAGRPLVVMGRYSLGYYLLHQPVMIGMLMLWGWLMRP